MHSKATNLVLISYKRVSTNKPKKFSKILKHHPKSLNARINLGTALKNQNKFVEAEDHLRKVAAPRPKSSVALNNPGHGANGST